jgi:hypothetical protein
VLSAARRRRLRAVGCPLTFDEFQLPVPVDRADLAAGIQDRRFHPSSNLGIGIPKSIAA